MTVSITIRHVPEEVRDRLAERAARSGRSLQEYLNAELRELATRPSPVDFVRGLAADVELNTGGGVTAQEILDALNPDRQ
jgi:plasmid stability protein